MNDLTGSKVLVTGGGGLIGSHIVDDLVRENVGEVVVFDSMARGKPEHLEWAMANGNVQIVQGDLRDKEMLSEAMEGCDYVFHQAAAWLRRCQQWPRMSVDVNIIGTFNVLEACVENDVKKLVAASSSSVYGDGLYLPTDEKHPYNNDLFYGAAKVCNEQHYRCFKKKYDLDFVAFRYLNIFGPRQPYDSAYMDVIMHFINRVENDMPPLVRGDGSATVDLVFVEDVARANIMAMKSDVTDEFFNVASGKETSVKELAEIIIDLCGKTGKITPQFEGEMDAKLVSRRYGCPKKGKELLDFEPQISVRDGLMKTIEWRRELEAKKNA